MKWTAGTIARAIALQTLAKKCVVLVDNCNWTGRECDVLGVTRDLRIIDVEVKISRSDFKADAKKDKWWDRKYIGQGPVQERHNEQGRLISRWQESIYETTPRQHPIKVWKHYFAMPAAIWKPDLTEFLPSQASGVLLLREGGWPQPPVIVECVRRSTPNKDAFRLKPEHVIDIARLANLRMWEEYGRNVKALQEVAA